MQLEFAMSIGDDEFPSCNSFALWWVSKLWLACCPFAFVWASQSVLDPNTNLMLDNAAIGLCLLTTYIYMYMYNKVLLIFQIVESFQQDYADIPVYIENSGTAAVNLCDTAAEKHHKIYCITPPSYCKHSCVYNHLLNQVNSTGEDNYCKSFKWRKSLQKSGPSWGTEKVKLVRRRCIMCTSAYRFVTPNFSLPKWVGRRLACIHVVL